MKKRWLSRKWLVGLAAGAVLVIGVGVAVPVLARTQQGPGTMGEYYGQSGQNGFGSGIMRGWGNGNVGPGSPSGSESNSGSTAVPGRGYSYGMMGSW